MPHALLPIGCRNDLREAEAFGPDVVGFGLFTRWVYHAYALAEMFRGKFVLVAGGAHTTVRADETLRHGFDVAVIGEAEETIVALVDALEQGRALETVGGVRFRDGDGTIRQGPPRDLSRVWMRWRFRSSHRNCLIPPGIAQAAMKLFPVGCSPAGGARPSVRSAQTT